MNLKLFIRRHLPYSKVCSCILYIKKLAFLVKILDVYRHCVRRHRTTHPILLSTSLMLVVCHVLCQQLYSESLPFPSPGSPKGDKQLCTGIVYNYSVLCLDFYTTPCKHCDNRVFPAHCCKCSQYQLLVKCMSNGQEPKGTIKAMCPNVVV